MLIPRIQTKDLALLLVVAGFTYLLLFRLPFDPFYYEADHLIFLENADRMINGQSIYRDFFQFTFPGSQVVYYLLFSVFGVEYCLSGLTIAATATLTFWLVLRISKQVVPSPYSYLPPMIITFFGFRWFCLTAGLHWTASALFVWIAVLAILKNRNRLGLAWAGLFCGLASFFTQQRGVVAMAGIGLFILVELLRTQWDWKEFLIRELTLAASFAVTLLVLLGYFLVNAGPGEFVWSTLTYPSKYYHYYEYNNPGAILKTLSNAINAPHPYVSEFVPAVFYLLAVPAVLIVSGIVLFRNRQKRGWEELRGPMLLAVTGFALVFSQVNISYSRLYHVSAGAMILLVWLLHYFGVLTPSRKYLFYYPAALLLGLAVTMAVYFQLRSDYRPVDLPRGSVYLPPDIPADKYLWLKERTLPGDSVLEGTQPYMSFMLGLRSCCRYSQFVPTEYTRPEFVDRTVTDLENTRPQFIIWDDAYRTPDGIRRDDGDNLGPLAEYIERQYSPAGPTFRMEPRQMRVWIRDAARE